MADNGLFEPAAGTPAAWPDNRLLAAPPSMADAYDYHAQALQKWMAEQRAAGVAAGTNDPETGWPTQKGVVDAIGQAAQGVMMGTTAPGFRAYHGSPHSFDAFDSAKIGTGEGAQAYGHGLYVADSEGVARSYRDKLAPLGMQTARGGIGADGMAARALQLAKSPEEAAASLDYNLSVHKAANDGKVDPDFQAQVQEARRLILDPAQRGSMYEVQVNADPAHFLDWDKPLSEQSPHVRDGVLDVRYKGNAAEIAAAKADPDYMGRSIRSFYYDLQHPNVTGNPAAASEALKAAGIPGIRYLDGGSRADGTGTSNHVIFDANTIAILRKYGIAGLIAGGGAAAAGKEQ